MAAPTQLTNETKVAKSVARALTRITHANGFYNDGLVVAAGVDPTNLEQDILEQFRDKHRIASIFPAVDAESPNRTAGVKRKTLRYPIACAIQLTDEDQSNGRDLNQLYAEFKDDLYNLLETAADSEIQDAAEALGYPQRADGKYVSCLYHRITDVQNLDIVGDHLFFDAICEYQYDRPTR